MSTMSVFAVVDQQTNLAAEWGGEINTPGVVPLETSPAGEKIDHRNAVISKARNLMKNMVKQERAPTNEVTDSTRAKEEAAAKSQARVDAVKKEAHDLMKQMVIDPSISNVSMQGHANSISRANEAIEQAQAIKSQIKSEIADRFKQHQQLAQAKVDQIVKNVDDEVATETEQRMVQKAVGSKLLTNQAQMRKRVASMTARVGHLETLVNGATQQQQQLTQQQLASASAKERSLKVKFSALNKLQAAASAGEAQMDARKEGKEGLAELDQIHRKLSAKLDAAEAAREASLQGLAQPAVAPAAEGAAKAVTIAREEAAEATQDATAATEEIATTATEAATAATEKAAPATEVAATTTDTTEEATAGATEATEEVTAGATGATEEVAAGATEATEEAETGAAPATGEIAPMVEEAAKAVVPATL